MPNVPRKGGWSNYTASQSVTGSYSQCRLCDSLSNPASVTFFFKPARGHSVSLSGRNCRVLVCSDRKWREFSPWITHVSLIVGWFTFIGMSRKHEKYRITWANLRLHLAWHGVQLYWTLMQFATAGNGHTPKSVHVWPWPEGAGPLHATNFHKLSSTLLSLSSNTVMITFALLLPGWTQLFRKS